MQNDAEFDKLASQASPLVNMPFFSDLTGESETVIEGDDLTADKISSKKDVAVILRRAKMWSATDLSAAMSGADPMAAIASLVSDFLGKRFTKGAYRSAERYLRHNSGSLRRFA